VVDDRECSRTSRVLSRKCGNYFNYEERSVSVMQDANSAKISSSDDFVISSGAQCMLANTWTNSESDVSSCGCHLITALCFCYTKIKSRALSSRTCFNPKEKSKSKNVSNNISIKVTKSN